MTTIVILRECDEDNCIIAGETSVTAEALLPGTYYIVVDCMTDAWWP